MQISSTDIYALVGLTSLIFLIAPLFLILYVSSYNRRKKAHAEEKEWLKRNFENELLRTQMEVQEQTLQNVAAELHDNIGQMLSLTTVTLTSININNVGDTAKVLEKVQAAQQLASRSVKELRQLSRLLYGKELISQGLKTAIGLELEWLGKTGMYQFSFESDSYQPDTKQTDNEIILFRLFQEIINNVVKHAHATIVSVELKQTAHDTLLTIKDNGQGFIIDEKMKKSNGMGLHSIQRRAAILGGSAAFTSIPGEGTEVFIKVPKINEHAE
jgi:signal transduction histidine kinase